MSGYKVAPAGSVQRLNANVTKIHFINVMTIDGGSLNYILDKKILDMERLKNQLMSEMFTNFMISTRLDRYNNDNIFI